ncbi:pentatricopeptide repeat-containing protein At4g02750 [Selaginella moellendorffii]|uniref:pentatricopeptide repeat-containing protein At4g02750 n=1 Tax=Selaginella moellendorffii TaxID=88036 RepID=UPI000D1C24E3|nr:pentatricopeptide repeat-containing protein At4g02750 [Selaginella moellendorffii]|eukprot:XP_002974044.2 pentatricopeptide repeat-containing protein At4g02750 [Selaginella moellendorffii]
MLEGSCVRQITWSQTALEKLVSTCDKSQLNCVEELIFTSENGKKPFLGNTLIQKYWTFGCVEDALRVFNRLEVRNIFSWSIMVGVYAQLGNLCEARALFDAMPQRTVVVWNSILSAYTQDREHSHFVENYFSKIMPEWDVISWNVMISFYAQAGRPEDARNLFDAMPEHTLVSWTALLQAYSFGGHTQAAAYTFSKMPEINSFSWNIMIAEYAAVGDFGGAKRVFDSMPELCRLCCNTMLSACIRAGNIEQAFCLYNVMQERDTVTHNAMVYAFARAGYFEESKRIFETMPEWDIVSFNAVFETACANMESLDRLKHAFMEIKETNIISWTILFQAYAQRGHLDSATKVFETVPVEKNVVLWTAMVASHAHLGKGEKTLELLSLMELDGVEPNQVSFLFVLSSCSHVGLLDEAFACFARMVEDHRIVVSDQHYCILVDLLSRSGELKNAEKLQHCSSSEPGGLWSPWLESHGIPIACPGSPRIYLQLDNVHHPEESLADRRPGPKTLEPRLPLEESGACK